MSGASALTVVLALLAGGLGSAARFVVDGVVRPRATSARLGGLSVATTVVNATGSLALGAITGLVLAHGAPSALALVAGTGFLGGYTTFSTASVEVVRLLQEGRVPHALAHAGTMLVLSVGAAAAGLAVTTA